MINALLVQFQVVWIFIQQFVLALAAEGNKIIKKEERNKVTRITEKFEFFSALYTWKKFKLLFVLKITN